MQVSLLEQAKVEGDEEMTPLEAERYFEEYIFPPKVFIYNDIQREINLARSGDSGGNFLATLGLLCYTEFMGTMILKGQGSSRNRFNAFFRLMGEDYEQLIDAKRVDVYGIFRCGMAHTYFAKNCDIKMLNRNDTAGIVMEPDGKYLFIVEKYFEDFMNACSRLYNDMIVEQNPYLPST